MHNAAIWKNKFQVLPGEEGSSNYPVLFACQHDLEDILAQSG
jgi:hypothetical protein